MHKIRLTGKTALLIAACSAAFSAPLNKVALAEGIHPIWLNTLRLAFVLAFMLTYKQRVQKDRSFDKKTTGLTLLSGMLMSAHLLCWVFALKMTDALAATTIYGTYLFMAAAGSVLLLKEHIHKGLVYTMLFAMGGVLICGADMSNTRLSGNLFALGSAASYAGYLLCGRFIRQQMDTYRYTRIVYSTALLSLLLSALLFRLPIEGLTVSSVSAIVGLAVFSTLLGHTLCNYALRTISAMVVSTVMLTELITGPIMVFFIMSELPTHSTLIGGGVILLAVVWYLWNERKKW